MRRWETERERSFNIALHICIKMVSCKAHHFTFNHNFVLCLAAQKIVVHLRTYIKIVVVSNANVNIHICLSDIQKTHEIKKKTHFVIIPRVFMYVCFFFEARLSILSILFHVWFFFCLRFILFYSVWFTKISHLSWNYLP